MDEQTFTVELDFSGTFSIDIDAIDAREAYSKALKMLTREEFGEASVALRKIESYQVFDERMEPCDLQGPIG